MNGPTSDKEFLQNLWLYNVGIVVLAIVIAILSKKVFASSVTNDNYDRC